MSTKKTSTVTILNVSESTLIFSVAEKLRYKVLFPEKVESSRKFLKSVTKSVI